MTTPFRKLTPAMLVFAWFIAPATGHAAAAACATSAASLKGWYGVLVSGNTLAANGTNADTKYLAGSLYFDGVSAVSGANMYGAYGVDSTVTGTYGVNADCTLTIDLTLTPIVTVAAATAAATTGTTSTYTVAVKASGEAVGIETDASAVAKIDLKPQTGSNGTNFTQASMNGSFVAACYGPFYAYSDLNVATFANGTGSGVDPYENTGLFLVDGNPYTVTYTVNPDGTFVGVADITDATLFFNFYGVISNSGSQVQYFYLNNLGNAPASNTDAIESCSGISTAAPVVVTPPGTQTITFNAIASQTVGTVLPLSATASSGLAVAFAASPQTVCMVAGTSASMVGAGTCTIVATQPGNGTTVAAATPVSQSFMVNAVESSQSITFGAIASQKAGTSLALKATASSGLTVAFASNTPSVCTVSGTSAALNAPGTCTIVASQAGNGTTISAATPVSQSFMVTAAPSFALSSSAASVSVTPPICILAFCFGGINATDTLTVTPANGFTGSVSFAVSGLPSGVTASFSPATVSGSGSTRLTLTPSSTTAKTGSTSLTISATSSSAASESVKVTLSY